MNGYRIIRYDVSAMWLFWYDDDANKLSGTRLTNKVKYILYSALYYICCGNRQHQVWINTKWVTFQHSIFPQNDLRPLFDFRSHCLFSLLKRMFWSKRNGDNYEWGGGYDGLIYVWNIFVGKLSDTGIHLIVMLPLLP